jgi:hypothetical protein
MLDRSWLVSWRKLERNTKMQSQSGSSVRLSVATVAAFALAAAPSALAASAIEGAVTDALPDQD